MMNKEHTQLTRCPHGTYFLRINNTTLQLTEKQVLNIYAELDRCICFEDDTQSNQNTKAKQNTSHIDACLN